MPRPSGRDPETDPAAFLGARLREARVAAGFKSQDALAAQLGFDRSVITKAETGDRPPSADVLSAWCEACQLDQAMYAGLAKLARSADGPVPEWFKDWLEVEQRAHTLRLWQPIIVPGLLQTAEYARALFLAAGDDAEQADRLVAERLKRQAIFERSAPPHAVVVLDEAVLHRFIGSPAVMHDQLAQLVELAGRPNLSVEVVPASTGANGGLSVGFQLVSCDGEPDVLNMNGVEDVTTENRSIVRHATIVFDLVRGDALPRTLSRTLITEAAEAWKNR